MFEERKQCVLVVDDHPQVLKLLDFNLTLNGFEVIAATSGVEALKILESIKPDVIVLDIVMPHISGFEILRRVREFTQLPVIAISANTGNRETAIQLGADDFITKPFDFNELVARIKKLLSLPKADELSLLQVR